jgi:hypothetical protein
MARRGVTRPDAVLKLQALYPAIDVDLAEDALKGSAILFSKAQIDDIFSKEALAAGDLVPAGIGPKPRTRTVSGRQ